MSPATALDRAGRRGSTEFDLALEEERGSPPYPVPTGNAGGGNSAPNAPPLGEGVLRASLPGRAPEDPSKEGSPGRQWSESLREWFVCGSDFVPKHVCRRVDVHADGRAVVEGAWGRCDRRDCPRCAGPCEGSPECGPRLKHPGGEWAHREGAAAADRWEDFLEQAGYGKAPLRQVIVSAPPGEFDPSRDHAEVIAAVRRRTEARLRDWSWARPYPGGAVVVHLWRGCFHEGYSTWGPHAHAICLGVDVRKTAAYERRTGWVVKQATMDGTPRSPFVGYRGTKLRRLLIYELGHAAILADRPALVWVGPELRRWKPTERPEDRLEGAEAPRCPECRERMAPWSGTDHLVRSVEGWGMTWIGCDRRQWIPVRLLDGPGERELARTTENLPAGELTGCPDPEPSAIESMLAVMGLVLDPSLKRWGHEPTPADRNAQYEPRFWPDQDPDWWVRDLAHRDPAAYRKLLDTGELP